MNNRPSSLEQWQNYASSFLTGGMSSSFRANQFTGLPMYAREARGPLFWDVTGKRYIDFFLCHGAVLLGHHHPSVHRALADSLSRGFYAGMDTEGTVSLAEKICRAVPGAERIRFVNSGTEATLLALRLARGYTRRDRIVRIDGHFHGIQDYLLSNNLVGKRDTSNDGSRLSRVVGRTAGVPAAVDELVRIVPWNNLDIMEQLLHREHEHIAGVIMNIIDYNNGCFVPDIEYLQRVRELTRKWGIVLIFDEILSGFKTGLSCAQGYFGVTPDICTLGKALTNDVPLSVVAGSKPIMDRIIDPEDPVIAGGTFSGNQFGVAAGNAVMDTISAPGFYDDFSKRTRCFYRELGQLFDRSAIPCRVEHLGAGFHLFFGTRDPVASYEDLKRTDRDLARRFFTRCIAAGLYFHTDFTVSAAHDQQTLDEALGMIEDVLGSMAGGSHGSLPG